MPSNSSGKRDMVSLDATLIESNDLKSWSSNFEVKAFRMEKKRVELQSQFSSFDDFKPHHKVFQNTNIG